MSLFIYLESPFDYVVTDSNGKEKSRGQLSKLEDILKIKARGPR